MKTTSSSFIAVNKLKCSYIDHMLFLKRKKTDEGETHQQLKLFLSWKTRQELLTHQKQLADVFPPWFLDVSFVGRYVRWVDKFSLAVTWKKTQMLPGDFWSSESRGFACSFCWFESSPVLTSKTLPMLYSSPAFQRITRNY